MRYLCKASAFQGRVAVIPDIGAQLPIFERILTDLGVDDFRRPILPDYLLAVQVGDIVRVTGLDRLQNRACVELAARLLDFNPGRYFQVLGNHDVAYLGGPVRPGVDPGPDPGVGDLLAPRSCGAVALVLEDGRTALISHAGLTFDLWASWGRPGLAGSIQRINDLCEQRIWSPGELTGGGVNYLADPMQATFMEVYGSWLDSTRTPPFIQIHGHNSPFNLTTNAWRQTVSPRIRQRTVVEPDGWNTRTMIDTVPFFSVDWGMGDNPTSDPYPVPVIRAAALDPLD